MRPILLYTALAVLCLTAPLAPAMPAGTIAPAGTQLSGGAEVEFVCNRKCREARDRARRHARDQWFRERKRYKHHKHERHRDDWRFGRRSHSGGLGSHEAFGKGYTYYGDPGQMFNDGK
ncbi:MAG: hypothetical protein AAF371_09505 [Pseudomonadota bacterium]